MFGFLRRLFHKKDRVIVAKVESINITPELPYVFKRQEVIISRPKAVNQDVSRFMKHGRQNSIYRHAVRAHVNPDEEDIP
jgi:hypothetical protein